ncbi:hypothetical protein PR202_gb06331 [Eleusine coracana subsp. coracana]|uniref:Uncharacterized protein n=1 Tax=Eleusine coracana subsp. coracana TaxID=191504 RepID=A0AAV5E6V6_ELECO|nr:hypothetical protein PR202_gb06331 [Eleusine coracana subsp. coracana]
MVESFVSGMSGLVSHLKSITQTLAAETRHHLSVQDIYVLSGLLKKPLEFDKSDNPMGIAVLRIPPASTEKVSVELTESLRGVLLDRVHDLYLKAVSRLPMKEFQTHHHRGLLKAGYCYGPFDPVYNIIVNTIWYNTTFPTSQEFEVDMVCTMRHIESRSLNGLIAFLRASIPQVSEHEAMTYLLKSDLKLCRAIQMAKQEHQTPGSDDEIGYKAAVNASSHPRSEEFLKVVIQTWPKVLSAVRSMMKASHLISSSAIIHLFRLLGTRANLLEPTLKLTKDALDMLSRYKKEFLTQQSIVRAKVEAALKKYGHAQGYSYELGLICVVNNRVGKKMDIRNSKQQYSHVNFWAIRENERRPTLFFAQFNNDEDSANLDSICCPVPGPSTHDGYFSEQYQMDIENGARIRLLRDWKMKTENP